MTWSSSRLRTLLIPCLATLLVACHDWAPADRNCSPSSTSPECVGADSATRSGSAAPSADGDAGPIPNGRPVLAGHVTNARDLGGTPLPGGASVAFDVLFRGPALARLDETGCSALADLGVRSIVDLREDSERASSPTSECAAQQANVVSAPLPIPFSVSAENYIADLNTTDSIAAAFAVLGDDNAYPVWFHCTYGRDRSGVFAALVLLSLGATRQDIVAEYKLSSTSAGAYPASLEAMLDELEAMGGIDPYLEAIGITAEQRAVLDARARIPAPDA